MASVNINDVLKYVYGPKGLPFPKKPDTRDGNPIAGHYNIGEQPNGQVSASGKELFGKNVLGMPVFLPATLSGIELPNPLVSISGEKAIIETDVINVGTVFEKTFTRPYDIIIICTLINAEGTWPENEIVSFEKLYAEGTLYTLNCALTDIFLEPEKNFILTKIDVIDMGQCENAQVIQLTGRSNKQFELILS